MLARPLDVDVFKKYQQVQREARRQSRKYPVSPGYLGVATVKVLKRQRQTGQRHEHSQKAVAHGVWQGFADLAQQAPAHEQIEDR